MVKQRIWVALHPEGVDRNFRCLIVIYQHNSVALHPEGVDRNLGVEDFYGNVWVALHPEGVDRNLLPTVAPRV